MCSGSPGVRTGTWLALVGSKASYSEPSVWVFRLSMNTAARAANPLTADIDDQVPWLDDKTNLGFRGQRNTDRLC